MTVALPRADLRDLERDSPIESLALYRALAACHVAGGILLLVGLPSSGEALVAEARLPLAAVGLLQVAGGGWLVRRPRLVPRVVHAHPGITWIVALVLALALMASCRTWTAAPINLSAAAWVATAGVVGPRRRWAPLGAAVAVAALAIWSASGMWDSTITGETILVGFSAALPMMVNAAWMGAAGNEAAWRLRSWGIVASAEHGAFAKLRDASKAVRHAADDVLAAVTARPVPASSREAAIATVRLRADAELVEADPQSVLLVEHLERTLAGVAAPWRPTVRGDEEAALPADEASAVLDALLRQLANIVRHAPDTTTVTVTVVGGATTVDIICEDDGGGALPAAEGQGTGLSRAALARFGGSLTYRHGVAGLQLHISVPTSACGAPSDTPSVGLADTVSRFVEDGLRNNRLVSWAIPAVALPTACDLPWSVTAIYIGAAVAIERVIATQRSLLVGETSAMVSVGLGTVALTLLLSSQLRDASAFIPVGATTYPIIEIAWRRRWRLWALFEFLRLLAMLPWCLAAGVAGLATGVVYPLVATLLVVGASRLVRRAEALETSIGDTVSRRNLALDIARTATLRHDVVQRARIALADSVDPELITRLDRAVLRQERMVPEAQSTALDAIIAGAQAALIPIPLHRTPDAGGPANLDAGTPGPAALRLQERLEALERGAAIGAACVFAAPPHWNGRRRLAYVSVRRSKRDPGALVFALHSPGRHEVPPFVLPADWRATTA